MVTDIADRYTSRRKLQTADSKRDVASPMPYRMGSKTRGI
jgi:hypothetical protein